MGFSSVRGSTDELMVIDEESDAPQVKSVIAVEIVDTLVEQGGNVEASAELLQLAPKQVRDALRNPGVRDYMRWKTNALIQSVAPLAVSNLISLSRYSRSDKVKLDASCELLRLGEYGGDVKSASTGGVNVLINLSPD